MYYQVILKANGPIDWVCKSHPTPLYIYIMILIMVTYGMFELWSVFGLTQYPTTYSKLVTSIKYASCGAKQNFPVPRSIAR